MWIAIFVVFMSLVVVGIIVACIIYLKMDKDNAIVNENLENIKEENIEKNNEKMEGFIEADEEMEECGDSSGEYEKLFPYVMVDEDDGTVDDNDKFLDDMIFMDLMDED